MTAPGDAVDVVVVGSGVAGLTCATDAAAYGLSTTAVTKGTLDDGSTRWAQGGIAVVGAGTGDSVAAHLADTVAAGAGLCDVSVAREILADGPAAVDRLRRRGAVLDRDAGLHGANRLASNSLLEGLVMGARAARALAVAPVSLAMPTEVRHPSSVWFPADRREAIQRAMSRHVVGRDAVGLAVVRRLADRAAAGRAGPDRSTVEATNLAQVSAVLATVRTASLGCHVRTDARADDIAGSLFVSWRDGAPVVGERGPVGREVVAR